MICDKCFIKFIKDITHNRIILNKFEIKTENYECICPNITCKNNRIKNLDGFIYRYFNKIEEYIQKAEERLQTQAKNFCCICKKINNRYTFDIQVNNKSRKKTLKHTICPECKKNMDNQKKDKLKRNHQAKFMCILCE